MLAVLRVALNAAGSAGAVSGSAVYISFFSAVRIAFANGIARLFGMGAFDAYALKSASAVAVIGASIYFTRNFSHDYLHPFGNFFGETSGNSMSGLCVFINKII